MTLAFPTATSGLISGSGLAMAKIMGSPFMLSTCSTVSTSGAESPRKRSAPATASGRSPVLPSGLVFSANHRLDDTLRVAAHDVLRAGRHDYLGAGHPRSADAIHDDTEVFEVLANDLEGVDQGRQHHD